MSSRTNEPIMLERRLGQSGVVEVWSATLAGFGSCAVKFPAARWSGHDGAARLIVREFEFLQRAAHINVVRAIDLLPMRAGPALVMEYLSGGDLVALAGSHPKHWAGFVRDVARALAHVHDRGIVHGDVKPRNVLLDGSGGAKLVDFGIAADVGAMRRAGGTPAYQRASQFPHGTVDVRDDVYALAVMAYELLCGQLPYGLSPDGRALETPPVPPLEIHPAYADVPTLAELAALIEVLLSATAEGLDRPLDALDALLAAIIAEHD